MRKNTKIAFLIAAHHDYEQLLKLCDRLRDHTVYLHIDAKCMGFPIYKFQGLPNLTLLQPRLSVHWADFSQVQATLSMMRAVVESDQNFFMYVLLSEACYLVKLLSVLANQLAVGIDRNYIRLTKIAYSLWLYNLIGWRWRMVPLIDLSSLAKEHPVRKAEAFVRAVINKVVSKYPQAFETETGKRTYFGSNWWPLNETVVRSLVGLIDQNPRLVRMFLIVYTADEIFFHTLLGSSSFFARSEGLQEDKPPATNRYAPLHLIHPSEARLFGYDCERFFIRKVNTGDSGALLDRIEEKLLKEI